jgi:Integrase core domain
VLYAHELGLVPITTPAYCPESNGLAEGFVRTFKRDYVNVHELRDAESVLAQLAAWIDDDYNRLAPHSALGMRSPADYRAMTSARGELTPPSVLANRGADHRNATPCIQLYGWGLLLVLCGEGLPNNPGVG